MKVPFRRFFGSHPPVPERAAGGGKPRAGERPNACTYLLLMKLALLHLNYLWAR